MATRQGLSATNSQGVYDKTKQAYSDSNAPLDLERTILTTAPGTPPAGESVEWTPDGKSLYMKAPDATTTLIGPAPAGRKISTLTAMSTPADTDVVAIVTSTGTLKMSLNQLTTYFEQRARQNNAAIAAVTGYASDTYLVGSGVGVPNGRLQAKTMYRLRYKVTKTAAGTATPTAIVRFGTAGTTSDAAVATLTFPAQTAVVDSGMFEVFVTFRAVGTSAGVVNAIGMLTHANGTTGLSVTAAPIVDVTSSAFTTTTAGSMIGVSVNGGTSAAWTISMVQAELFNLA